MSDPVRWFPTGWSDLELEPWLPVLRKVGVLVLAAVASWGVGLLEASVGGELQATESQATEKARLEDLLEGEFETIHEMIRYYDRQAAACDTALEAFSRHRDDEEDWSMVLEACHSRGSLE